MARNSSLNVKFASREGKLTHRCSPTTALSCIITFYNCFLSSLIFTGLSTVSGNVARASRSSAPNFVRLAKNSQSIHLTERKTFTQKKSENMFAAECLFIRHVRFAMAFHKIEAHAVMAQPTGNEREESNNNNRHGVGFETTKSRKHRNTAFSFPADKVSQNAKEMNAEPGCAMLAFGERCTPLSGFVII